MKKHISPLRFCLTALVAITHIAFVHAQAPSSNSLLWKVTGKDASKPAYIYGTYHMLCSENLQINDSLQNIVAQCSSVYLELDMDDPSLMQQMQAGMTLPQGKTWKDHTDTTTYHRLDSAMKSIAGMPADAVCMLQPMTVLAFLYPPILQCQVVSPEAYFMQLAQAAGKPIHGIEPIAAQLKVFQEIPVKSQIQMLNDMILDLDKTRKESELLVQAYLAGDINEIYRLIMTSEMQIEGMEDLLLTNRNISWIPTIENNLSTATTFYAVGSGHLGGEQGVLNLLRKKGYTVTPVFYQ